MDLEQIWKAHNPDTGSLPDIKTIGQLSLPPSDTVLKKLKTTLLTNMMWAVLCAVLYVFVLINFTQWQILILIGITLAFTVWALFTAFQLYISVNPNVQANGLLAELKRNRDAINRWMKIQQRVALAIYPFSATGGFLLGGVSSSGKSIEVLMAKPVFGWSLVIAIMILTPLSYLLAKWLFKKSFGKVVQQMDCTIAQLTET